MTYSIVALDPETGHLGVAVASRFFAVGALVPHVRGGKGAIATQAFVNPLFPATVKSHYTLGLGYAFTPSHELNVSLTVAPESKVTNGQGVVVTHEQRNAQLMYSMRF